MTYQSIATKTFIGIFSLATLNASADRGDWGAGNGGDSCERRIQEIRNDIVEWIGRDGHLQLKFPNRVTATGYEARMTQALKQARISCTDDVLKVKNSEKTCLNELDSSRANSRIRCTYSKFMNLNEEDQYRLIHHEYAGLAGLEVNKVAKDGSLDESSNYVISNQISAFLEKVFVKKLAVKVSQKQKFVSGSIGSVMQDGRVHKASNLSYDMFLTNKIDDILLKHKDDVFDPYLEKLDQQLTIEYAAYSFAREHSSRQVIYRKTNDLGYPLNSEIVYRISIKLGLDTMSGWRESDKILVVDLLLNLENGKYKLKTDVEIVSLDLTDFMSQ